MTICTRLVVTLTTGYGRGTGYYQAWVLEEPQVRTYDGSTRAEAIGKCVLAEPCFSRPCGPLTIVEADHVHVADLLTATAVASSRGGDR